MSDLSFKERLAAWHFRKQRADYYAYLANMILASRGGAKLIDMVGRDVERFAGKPRGTLAAVWLERLEKNGSNLAEAWQGTLPDDEVAIVRVAIEAGGEGGLQAALQDLARSAKLVDRIRRNSIGVMMAAGFAVLLAAAMWTIMPIVVMDQLGKVFDFIDRSDWGPRALWLQAWGVVIAAAIGGVIALVLWSINNWTGSLRNWCDQHIVLWRAVRDVKGALFLATMSTLVQRRGNTMFTLSESLALFARSVRSKWMLWRVGEILDRVDQTGATDASAFDTPLLSREMYFYLRDMQESNGFSAGFEKTGRYIEDHMADKIERQMVFYRWLLLAAVGAAVLMFASVFGVIDEMRKTMANHIG